MVPFFWQVPHIDGLWIGEALVLFAETMATFCAKGIELLRVDPSSFAFLRPKSLVQKLEQHKTADAEGEALDRLAQCRRRVRRSSGRRYLHIDDYRSAESISLLMEEELFVCDNWLDRQKSRERTALALCHFRAARLRESRRDKEAGADRLYLRRSLRRPPSCQTSSF